MTNANSSGKTRWLLWVGALGVLAVAAISWRAWSTERAWNEMLVKLAAAQSSFDSLTRERPVLWGELESGRAIEHYNRAHTIVREVEDSRPDEHWELEFPLSRPTELPDSYLRLLDELQPAFEALRRGAHSTDALCYTPESAEPPMITSLPEYVTQSACRSVRDGDPETGIRRLLDLIQHGRDRIDTPVVLSCLVGWSDLRACATVFVPAVSTDETSTPKARIALDELPLASLETLASGLAEVDRPLPSPAHYVRGDALIFANLATENARALGPGFDGLGSWRNGFSLRRTIAEGFTTMFDFADKVESIPSAWTAHDDRFAAWDNTVSASTNEVVRLLAPNMSNLAKEQRRGQAHLRALRIAVAEALGGQLTLPDPFDGGDLLRGERNGKRLCWTRDANGRDDGGAPDLDLVFAW